VQNVLYCVVNNSINQVLLCCNRSELVNEPQLPKSEREAAWMFQPFRASSTSGRHQRNRGVPILFIDEFAVSLSVGMFWLVQKGKALYSELLRRRRVYCIVVLQCKL